MTPLATAPALPYQAAPMRLSVAPGAQPGTRIISMANQKGGVAKTTSTVNLAAALKERGKRVLVVDLDPQSNLTMSFGIDPEHLQQSMFDVLVHRLPIREVIQQREVDVAASSIDLAGAELALSAMIGRERTLEKALAPVRDDYDFILLDTPPSLGLLTINAFTTSTGVIVPVQLEYLSLRGLVQLESTLQMIREHLNPAVHIEGILPTMVEGRTIHGREALDLLQANFHDLVFETRIKKSVKLAEAPVQGGSVLSYQPDGAGANAYRALAEEVLSRVE
ncbi:MAG: AAA family ATPase [Gaiellales bacterium]|jgi:chromosome partitioning protein|nr:AAA family ATPase [Gaiellales bacterium]